MGRPGSATEVVDVDPQAMGMLIEESEDLHHDATVATGAALENWSRRATSPGPTVTSTWTGHGRWPPGARRS